MAKERPIWILIPLILALLPFSVPIKEGSAAGAGADVVNTLWAMWWFQQELPWNAWGGHSQLFNFPFGGEGAILSPMFAFCWALLDVICGASMASLLTSMICLYGTLALMILIARAHLWSSLSIGIMLMAFLCQRYFIFTLGETGVVGVAILPLLFCWYAILCFQKTKKKGWLVVIVLCVGLQGLENPYLAPVPPIIVVFGLWRDWKSLFQLMFAGCIGLVLIGSLYHGTSASEYQSLRPSSWTMIFGQHFPVVEREWAQLSAEEFLYPQRPRWPIGGQDTIHQAGRGFVGYSVLLAGIIGFWVAKKEKGVLIFLCVWGIVFALGSEIFGYASPFALFNSLCAHWVRALTQPTRYLLLAVLALAFGCAYLSEWLQQKNHWFSVSLWTIIGLEALLVGGLSLRMPATDLPEEKCIQGLSDEEGGVLVWPWDGIDDVDFDATLYSRLFQMVHDREGATIGTGSWPLEGKVFPGVLLRELGWNKAKKGEGKMDLRRLSRWGYQWAIVDGRVSRTLRERARNDIFGSDALVNSCGYFDIYRLQRTTPEKKPVHPFQNRDLPAPKRIDGMEMR